MLIILLLLENQLQALDCKQKKSRSRSGSKKKLLTLPHGADEVYILRCRCILKNQVTNELSETDLKSYMAHNMLYFNN
ncbi:hypothetical protein E5288_WYG002091 [Bos mutus]|uniref:Uncharacterized protein n=1 Tax=Bos mutus TaxID=72004 RepID=A0A6B0R795_9CETA|nr:hypothetical protein [Bos mutus]